MIYGKIDKKVEDAMCQKCFQCWNSICRAYRYSESKAETYFRSRGSALCQQLQAKDFKQV